MNDLPETPREINKAKAQLFKHQREFLLAKDSVNPAEREWIEWSSNRIPMLEAEE